MNSQRLLISLGRYVVNRSAQQNGLFNNSSSSSLSVNQAMKLLNSQQHVHSPLCCCNSNIFSSKRYFASSNQANALKPEEFEDEEDEDLQMMEEDMDQEQEDDDLLEEMEEDDEEEEGRGINKEYSTSELHDMIRETQISIYRDLLDCPKPLDSEVKKNIYNRWKEDPKYYNTKKLSQIFHIHRARVAAIIRFQQIYEKEVAEGNEVFDDLEQDIAELLGTRMKDSYLGGDVETSDEYFFRSGKDNELDSEVSSSGKPDPIHEIPVKIPPTFPEKPIYFRQPMKLSKPKRKNLIFVDTSRDPFTNRPNPDPMMLISGIDGSLRTPSTNERKVIGDYIKNPKIKRDPESLLRRPLKYKPANFNDGKKVENEKEEEDD